MRIMYDYARNNNDSIMHDSYVRYDDFGGRSSTKHDSKKSLKPVHPNLNYHASNERSQLSDSTEVVMNGEERHSNPF